MKVCPRCQVEKEVNDGNFYTSPGGRVAAYCRPCNKEYMRRYAKANRDKFSCPKAAQHYREKILI